MNISVYELVAIMGIPSAVTGLFVWWLKRWLEKREQRAEERSKALTDVMSAQIMVSNASLSLAEATANAVARIPDAHCNGDMHEALAVAKDAKHKQRELLMKLGLSSAVD